MSAPLRFLAVALLGWAGMRLATLGMLPGAQVFEAAKAQTAPLPPIVPTTFAPIEPVHAAAASPAYPQQAWPYPYAAVPQRVPVPVYYLPVGAAGMSAAAFAGGQPLRQQPPVYAAADYGRPDFYAPITPLDDWQLPPAPASAPGSATVDKKTALARRLIGARHLDRLQFSAWALWRGGTGGSSLANGGTLGGSQVGARLTYRLNPRLAVSLRSYSPASGIGGEVAGGLRVQPFPSIPVAITAERRQAASRFGGRSAFALFAEGGVYGRPLPWNFSLDAYAQAGVVGFGRRDLFLDGGVSALRPIWGPVSAGFGVWGGAQPGVHRLDAGPRVSLRLRRNMRVDLDYRQRLIGNAAPASGPALTLAADF
jgi:hypothetical protein